MKPQILSTRYCRKTKSHEHFMADMCEYNARIRYGQSLEVSRYHVHQMTELFQIDH